MKVSIDIFRLSKLSESRIVLLYLIKVLNWNFAIVCDKFLIRSTVYIFSWRYTLDFFKNTAEIKGAFIAEPVRYFINFQGTLIKKLLCTLNFSMVYIIYKSQIIIFGKENRKVIRTDVKQV